MIGIGYDVHRLEQGERLILGGVEFDFPLGTVAHSDGDVLAHAIMDALLGAIALGDIGLHFPDVDDAWRGADSLSMLRHVNALIRGEGAFIINVDSSVVLEAPKLRPYIDDMRSNIADALELDMRRVSIKATTNERMGFVGRQEGVAAMAVAQLEYVV